MANSFGTSVGSKTLMLWSAVVIAGIFEFLGALLLGGQVTRTIAGGIARVTTFRRFPAQFLFGACDSSDVVAAGGASLLSDGVSMQQQQQQQRAT